MDISITQVGTILVVSFLTKKAIDAAHNKIAFGNYLYNDNGILKINLDGDRTNVSFINWITKNCFAYEIKTTKQVCNL